MKEKCPPPHTEEGMGRGVSARTWQRMLCLGLDLEEEEAVGERDIGIKGTQAEKRPLPRPSMKRPQTSGMLVCARVVPALGRLWQKERGYCDRVSSRPAWAT